MEATASLTPLAEEDSQEDVNASSVYDPTSLPPHPTPSTAATSEFGMQSTSKYSPLPWTDYFDEERDVKIEESGDIFHIYLAGSQGPVLFCIHGGGYSGLSFALAAGLLKQKVRLVALDMRGHGSTHTSDDLNLSTERLCRDVVDVINAMYAHHKPAIVLIGHSMGGSIATKVAAQRSLPNLQGLIVVDVVEGTAVASLVHMQKILSNRPPSFPNIEKAIEWSVKAGSLRNVNSARISVPSTLKYDQASRRYVWRTPLEKSEPFWRDWYEGLSEVFLASPVAKILMLAGTDRLDRVLTIGQMQGKFQMIIVRHSGHAIQEDEPEEFSNVVLGFVTRNRIGPYGLEIPGLRRAGC